MRVAVDVRGGQKTGYFLDQRENRLALRRYARGKVRAANCFSYSGGFSVSALLGGAREVVSVDRDESALRLARRNFELNGFDPERHAFVAGDVLDFLRQQQQPYDLLVLDPPAFAKSQKAVPAALDGYASLHRAALGALAPGGILATASCSARVSAEEFAGAIRGRKVGEEISLDIQQIRDLAPGIVRIQGNVALHQNCRFPSLHRPYRSRNAFASSSADLFSASHRC